MNKEDDVLMSTTVDVMSPSKEAAGVAPLPKKRGKGRPPKSEIEAVKKGQIGQGKRGRPVGTAGRMEEFKARLLATAGDRMIDKVVSIAMDDEHPGQMAAMKMCVDRLLPLSYFDKKGEGGRGNIQINITGVNGETTTISNGADNNNDIEDVDFNEVEE